MVLTYKLHNSVTKRTPRYVQECYVTEFGTEFFLWEWENKCGNRATPGLGQGWGPVHARQLDVELDASPPTFWHLQLQLRNLTRTESRDLKVQPNFILHSLRKFRRIKQGYTTTHLWSSWNKCWCNHARINFGIQGISVWSLKFCMWNHTLSWLQKPGRLRYTYKHIYSWNNKDMYNHP
jgi:hypothetical protein